jgi:hypothetical protein
VQSSSPSFILLEVTGEFLSKLNIFCLGALVTTGKKNDQHQTPLLKIDTVTRAIVDPQLRDSCPYRPEIARIPADDAFNPGLNESLSPEFPKASEPTRKLLCTAN